jgi:hypothetical protein
VSPPPAVHAIIDAPVPGSLLGRGVLPMNGGLSVSRPWSARPYEYMEPLAPGVPAASPGLAPRPVPLPPASSYNPSARQGPNAF